LIDVPRLTSRNLFNDFLHVDSFRAMAQNTFSALVVEEFSRCRNQSI